MGIYFQGKQLCPFQFGLIFHWRLTPKGKKLPITLHFMSRPFIRRLCNSGKPTGSDKTSCTTNRKWQNIQGNKQKVTKYPGSDKTFSETNRKWQNIQRRNKQQVTKYPGKQTESYKTSRETNRKWQKFFVFEIPYFLGYKTDFFPSKTIPKI